MPAQLAGAAAQVSTPLDFDAAGASRHYRRCMSDGSNYLDRRPDAVQLAKWLPEYRGVGQLRAEGYDSLVFPRPLRAADHS